MISPYHIAGYASNSIYIYILYTYYVIYHIYIITYIYILTYTYIMSHICHIYIYINLLCVLSINVPVATRNVTITRIKAPSTASLRPGEGHQRDRMMLHRMVLHWRRSVDGVFPGNPGTGMDQI